jgi:site-specific recombinase XerD
MEPMPESLIRVKIADFLLRVQMKRRAPATCEQYRFVLERILMPWCRDTGVSTAEELTDRAMLRFTDHLSEKKLSVASVQTYVRSVRIFLNWCKVPKGDYDPVQVPRRLRDTLSRAEVDRMESAATNERDKLIVRVLADTGIRVGELVGLRPRDLRGDTHTKQYFIRVFGKDKREREVGMPSGAYYRLKQFSLYLEEDDWIFNIKGLQMSRHSVDYIIRKSAKAAKIGRRIWPHLLRHSFITEMARRGVPVQDTMKAVGHTTPAMTMVVYNSTTASDSYNRIMAALK